MKRTRPAAIISCLVAFCLSSPWAATGARAERVIYASANGQAGYIDGRRIDAASLDAVLAKVHGRLGERTVIQLLGDDPTDEKAAVFHIQKYPCLYLIGRVEGAPDRPLVIRGLKRRGRWLTQIAADSIDDIIAGRLSCNRGIAQLRLPALSTIVPRAEKGEDIARRLQRAGSTISETSLGLEAVGAGNQYRLTPCFHVWRSKYVVFEDLHFKDCWVSAVYIVDSSDIRVAGSFIEGSSFPVFATASYVPGASVRGFTVENNVWIQDTSGYGPTKPAPCKEIGASLDCPGLVWTSIPWAVTHDTWYEHMNGGLFGSLDIGGGVVLRGNKVANAYNGIRMVTSASCNRDRACREATNRDVTVIDNDFIYIRDNAVEPEKRAVNWTIARNRIVNGHAWFSFDDVSGGPIYIWGNVGWYTDIPGRLCRDGPRHKQLVRVNFEFGGHLEIDKAGEPVEAFTCARSRFGTIIKEGSDGAALDKDIYAFHNSWYVRIPLIREGKVGRIRYWNNAMVSTGCGVSADPDSLCGIELSAGLEGCANYRDYVMDGGRAMLLRCVDPAQVADPLAYDIRFNVSNRGFPAAILTAPGRNGFAFAADPGFRAPERGDFRLRPGSPAIARGCVVEWEDRARGALRCRVPKATEIKPDIGAYARSGRLYTGPK